MKNITTYNNNMSLRCLTIRTLFFIILLFQFSCIYTLPLPQPHRQLTEEEEEVKIILVNQSQALKLNQKCTISLKIGTFKSKRDIKINAAINDANVAQILYSSTSTTSITISNSNNIPIGTTSDITTSYDVRFYTCSGDFHANLQSIYD